MNKRGLIGPGLFHGLVSGSSSSTTTTTDHSQSGVSAVSDCTDSFDRLQPEKRQKLIPMQVLVPPSLKSSSFSSIERPGGETNNSRLLSGSNSTSLGGKSIFDFMISEERVHGGGLMSLLGGSLKHPIDGI